MRSTLHYSDAAVCDEAANATCPVRVFVKWDDALVEIYRHPSSMMLAPLVRRQFPCFCIEYLMMYLATFFGL